MDVVVGILFFLVEVECLCFEWVVWFVGDVVGELGIVVRIVVDYVVCWLSGWLFGFVFDDCGFFEGKFGFVDIDFVMDCMFGIEDMVEKEVLWEYEDLFGCVLFVDVYFVGLEFVG